MALLIDKYFRIGYAVMLRCWSITDRKCYSHMGITVVDQSRGDIDRVVEGLKAIFQA